MRVAITLEQCWHRVPGGTAAAALGCVDALGRLTAPPEMVGISAWHRNPPEEPFAPSIEMAQLRLPRAGLYWGWHKLRWPSVQRAAGRVDAIHATGMAVPPRTAPLAVTVNDLAFLRHPDHFTPRGMRFFVQSLELTRKDADIVVCPSQHTADDCSRAGIPAERLRVVPYWTDDDMVPTQVAEEVRQKFGLAERFVLWVGTAEPRKNLAGLLEAWRVLGRTAEELVLVGPAGWKSNLDNDLAASKSNLGGALASSEQPVRRLGFVSETDKRALMRAASVVCYPSLTEGFGLPVLEAMVQGAPVVTSASGATAEVAGSAGVLVDPTQPTQIADALAGLLDDPDAAARAGKQGRERALAEFTWERTAGGLVDVYRELAG
ncbi:MAG: glycosyltransferase family 4 protein [Acidimicrobiia bacterium]|nr:glycosyltransferase family 4 protein [Acidimicrobiia bacterium]MCY4432377.1 glycosyltransferase family 1 protein [bacterium]